jgi:hypothetical protein
MQVTAIRQGLAEVVPERYLNLLTPEELEVRVCGHPDVDVVALRRHAIYSGITPSVRHKLGFGSA